MVKNAVIVPVGAKGGFVGKRLPDPARRSRRLARRGHRLLPDVHRLPARPDRQPRHRCRRRRRVVPPTDVRRYDGDDPYLVVAADKGTATFCDIANDIAARARLLARRRVRLRRLGRLRPQGDGHHRPRRLGVGQVPLPRAGREHPDAAVHRGRHRRHVRRRVRQRHAAVRPASGWSPPSTTGTSSSTPIPTRRPRIAERRRLFELPRSSWADYDTALISAGGGVFAARPQSRSRSRPQVAARLGHRGRRAPRHDADRADPARSCSRRSTCSGTAASAPTSRRRPSRNADAGDKANDAVRVDGRELRCRVVGEGGNLGCTQLGRIEYARAGGRINTDAIDNSAGVDTSDHEVNIKILLDRAVAAGTITRRAAQRAAGRGRPTTSPAHVLRDNYEQNVLLGRRRAARPRDGHRPRAG